MKKESLRIIAGLVLTVAAVFFFFAPSVLACSASAWCGGSYYFCQTFGFCEGGGHCVGVDGLGVTCVCGEEVFSRTCPPLP